MRNYISTLFQQTALHGDDGGGGTIDITATAAGRNADNLSQNMLIAIQFAEETNDPTHIYTWTQFPGAIATVYWLLDAANISIFANYLADFLYLAVVTIGNIPQMGLAKMKTDPTGVKKDLRPRKGWTDDEGVARKPPPSEQKRIKIVTTGAQTLFATVKALEELATELKKAGEIRDANIVTQAVNLILTGQLSITAALAFLTKAGIFD